MNKKLKIFTALLLTLLLCLSMTSFADSDPNDVDILYRGNGSSFEIIPENKMAKSDTFFNLKDAMPGDTLTQKIIVRNLIVSGNKIEVYLRSKGATAGSEAFLKNMTLSIKVVDGEELYKGPANENTSLEDWVDLGLVYSGGKVELELTLEVSKEMGDEFQNTCGYIDWEFKVEEYAQGQEDPVPTSDPRNLIPYVAALAACGAIFVILAIVKKNKNNEEA